MRVHKITVLSLWRMLLRQLVGFMEDKNPYLKDMLDNEKNGPIEELVRTQTRVRSGLAVLARRGAA